MRILWHSNAPFVGSGYGMQTDLFTKLLKQAGHEVILSAFHGLRGITLQSQGVQILPGSNDGWGNDILGAHYDHYKPDVLVALMDVWVLEKPALEEAAITAWAPIDHDPIPPLVLEKLRQMAHVLAMSQFAVKQFNNHAIPHFYVPHGVDTQVFRPIARSEARKVWGMDEHRFLAVCVGANKGYPGRKQIDKLLKAWAKFIETRPDALLYVHTEPQSSNGVDLVKAAEFYGIPGENLRFPDLYRLLRGDYTPKLLAALYSSADVFVLPTAGGGFEIPLIEAQACGCPVITTDFSAPAELVAEGGYKIPVDPFDDLVMTLQYSEQAYNLRPSAILTALEAAWDARGDQTKRKNALEFAIQYDGNLVLHKYMLPALEAIAEHGINRTLARQTARRNERLALRKDEKKAEVVGD